MPASAAGQLAGLWWMRKLAGPLVGSGWAGCNAKAKGCRPKNCADPCLFKTNKLTKGLNLIAIQIQTTLK
jgi:hypothetical protein